MKVFDFHFPIEIGSVCDFDFLPNGTSVTIQGTGSHQVLIMDDRRFELPDTWTSPEFPMVRSLPDGRVLCVDTDFNEVGPDTGNAWILSSKPASRTRAPLVRRSLAVGGALTEGTLRVEAQFNVSSSAVEIACVWGLIAVAYHPLSARAHGHQVQPVQRSGIAFFDLQGRMVMGFNTVCAPLGVQIENVRCMTALSRSQLLFVPETLFVHGKEVENPVVMFDCATLRPRVFSAPSPRAEACTMQNGWIHLASPEGWEDQIITFDPEGKISQHRGEFLGIFRGLENGAFLAQHSSAEYAVLVPGAPTIDSPLVSPLSGNLGLAPVSVIGSPCAVECVADRPVERPVEVEI
jgi:hypothetical protein